MLRVGGEDGYRLTRAAFAVMLKFSEQIDMFRDFWDEIEMLGLSLDGDKKSSSNLNQLAQEIREQKSEEFDILCAQWEQAA